MGKLYIFGIGGTGTRVLKSLTLLLAAGVECRDTIVPVVIDRDMANADLTRTKEIIDNYIYVSNYAPKTGELNRNRFFNTPIELLNKDMFLRLEDNTQVFAEYIHHSRMNEANKALVNLLFSQEMLQLDMTEGFQGNPNIGSVVLNQFDDTDIFKVFANDFQEGDKIFIISSIFGGTGASGFPLLLKNLKSAKPQMPNWGYVQNAPIGALSVLPYFNVSNQKQGRNEDSLVDSDTFIDKTKAALSYYMSLDGQLDVLYYIADKVRSNYEHNKGGSKQQNNAHFIELASALAILDFSNQPIVRNGDGRINQTIYKEFGIAPGKQTDAAGNELINDCRYFGFSDLADETKENIRNHLIQFLIFRKYLKEVYPVEAKYQPYSKKRFNKDFKGSDAVRKLESVHDAFYKWLQEMGRQTRSFVPFNLKVSPKDPFEFVTDTQESKRGSVVYKNWSWFDNELNRTVKDIPKSLSMEAQFIELFYRVTEKFATTIVKK